MSSAVGVNTAEGSEVGLITSRTSRVFGVEDERGTLKRVVERENGRVMDLKVERAPSGESINLCLISL